MADSLKIRIDGDTSDFESSLKGLGSVAKAGLAAVTAAVGAVASAMTYAASVGMEYETSLAKVNTIADTTATSLDTLSDGIMGMSSKYGIAASDLNEALYNTISAGVDTANSVEFLDQAIKLAEGGFTDTTSAVDVLTTVINAYGMEASDASKISDILIQTQNKGKTTVGELASSMGKIIPTANAYGVSLDNLAAGYAIMTANGVATAESTTYMNSMLNELGKSGMTAANNLKEATGKTFQELTASGQSLGDILTQLNDYAQKSGKSMGDMFGSAEAGKAALVLASKGADAFNESVKGMNDSVGATDAAFEKMENTTEKAMDKFKTSIQNAGIAFFDTFKEPLTEGLGEAQGAFTNLTNSLKKGKLGDSVKKLGKSVGDLIGKLGQMVSKVLPKLIDFVAKLVTALPKIFKVLKALAPVILAIVAAIKVYQAIVKVATVAQAALNAVMNMNPVVAIASAIIGLVTALGLLIASSMEATTQTGTLNEEQQEFLNSTKEATEEYKNLKSSLSETASAESEQSTRLKELWGELNTLADSSGKVQEKDQSRAQYILGELNTALGTEYSMNNGVIGQYQQMQSEIGNLIQAHQAQTLLTTYEELYTEAVNNRAAAEEAAGLQYQNVVNAQLDLENTRAITEEKYAEYREALEKGVTGRKLELLKAAWKGYEEGEKLKEQLLAEEEQAYNDQLAVVQGYYDDIAGYEDASVAVTEGNYNKAIGLLEELGDAHTSASKSVSDSSKSEVDVAKTNFEEASSKYVALVDNYKANQEKMTESEKREAQTRINNAKEEVKNAYNQYVSVGGNIIKGLEKGISDEEGTLYQQMRTVIDQAVKAARDEAQIKSPSRVFRDEVGEYIGQGIAVGIDESTDDVIDSAKEQIQEIEKAYDLLSISDYVSGIVLQAQRAADSIATVLGPLVPNFNGQGIIENNYNYNTYNQDTGTHTTVLELDGEVLYQSNQKYTTLHGASLVKA